MRAVAPLVRVLRYGTARKLPEEALRALYEGGDAKSMLARVAALKQSGVNIIVLLALSDDDHPGYHECGRQNNLCYTSFSVDGRFRTHDLRHR
jgi:hypothetical protein